MTQVLRMEDGKECKAIELRSGNELLEPHHKEELAENKQTANSEKENKDVWVEVERPVFKPEPTKYVPKLPYPERQQKIRMK